MSTRSCVGFTLLFTVTGFVVWTLLARNDAPLLTTDDVLNDITVTEELQEHANRTVEPKVIKVTEGVYVAVDFALANSIMIEGPDGLIIVDTTESMESASLIHREFRRLVPNKPIRAIVYTHSHPDHVTGAQSFIEPGSPTPDIWAHHSLLSNTKLTLVSGPKLSRGAIHQFGVRVGRHLVDVGIGPRLRNDGSRGHYPILPTKYIYDDRQQETIAGLNVEFIHIPGETADQIAVWLPDSRTLLAADDIYKSFPNLYAIRGTPPRDVVQWANSLRSMRDLDAEYLVPSHGFPMEGRKQIYDLFTVYISAVQLVHDQTVRWANRGLHPVEIASKIRLPPAVHSHPHLKQLYGRVDWSARTVYDKYFGWFSGDPVELLPLTPPERSRKMVGLLGVDGLLDRCKAALDEDDLQWALELCSYVFRLDRSNDRARQLRLSVLRRLASSQLNPLARNYYMTTALDDAGLLDWRVDPKPVVEKVSMYDLLDMMKIRLQSERVDGVNMTLVLNYTDVNEIYRVQIVYSVMLLERLQQQQQQQQNDDTGKPDDVTYDLKLTTTAAAWRQIVSGTKWPVWSYITGEVVVDGSLLKLRRFLSYFDRRF